MATPYPKEDLPELQAIIDQTYTDGLDSIDWARVEDDESTTVALCRDGAKLILAKITATGIKYKLINPAAPATSGAPEAEPSFSEPEVLPSIDGDYPDEFFADPEDEDGEDI